MWVRPLQTLQPLQKKKRNFNHLSVHQWVRSAIRDSQQPTTPSGFLFWNLSATALRGTTGNYIISIHIVCILSKFGMAIDPSSLAFFLPWFGAKPGHLGVRHGLATMARREPSGLSLKNHGGPRAFSSRKKWGKRKDTQIIRLRFLICLWYIVRFFIAPYCA